MDLKNFTSAMAQIAEEKGISPEKVISSIEMAMAAAYKKDYGKKGQIIRAKLNPETGEADFWQIKTVVSPEMLYSDEELEKMKDRKKDADNGEDREEEKIRFNPERHILIKEAEKIKKGIKVGEELEIPLKSEKDYGRIAAQTAKQVILQKIREAEKETILNEFASKKGEIISGVVQRIENNNVLVDVGKTLAVLPKEEQVRGEFYRPGQRFKFYLLNVEETPKGPAIILSRAYPKFISKLFELEVPEISQGQVVIKSIAREAGSRSKIAVEAEEEGIDPIGSAVGQRGTRVTAVINELGGEKVDIVEYSDDIEKFVANSLSPAKIIEVKVMPKNKVLCLVPEDQLSLAIGKDGQNVRLAAKLTGWKIDIKTPSGQGEKEIKEENEGQEGEITKEKADDLEEEVQESANKEGGASPNKKELPKDEGEENNRSEESQLEKGADREEDSQDKEKEKIKEK